MHICYSHICEQRPTPEIRWTDSRCSTPGPSVTVPGCCAFGLGPPVAAFPDDPLWGIGLRASDPLASSPGTWPGYNLLGFTLMEVRGALVRGPGRVAQWPTDALAPG